MYRRRSFESFESEKLPLEEEEEEDNTSSYFEIFSVFIINYKWTLLISSSSKI